MMGWIRAGRRRPGGAAIGALLLGATVVWPVSATLTSINVTGQPVVVGDSISYRALENENAPWPTNFSWNYRCTVANAQGTWMNVPFATAAWTIQERNVGSYEIKATSDMSDGSVKSITTNVTVAGPTTDKVNESQLGAVLYFMMGPMPLNLEFAVMHGDRKIGPYPDGYPQYRIRRPQFDLDTDWTSDPGYSLNGDTIVARVAIEAADFNNGFADLADGSVVDDYYLQNRMVIRNCAGTNEYFNFPERHFRKVKVGGNAWKLVEVAQNAP